MPYNNIYTGKSGGFNYYEDDNALDAGHLLPKVHIIIPCWNHWDLTHTLLGSLYAKERLNIDSVTVVDNGSDEEAVQQGLKWWMKEAKDFNVFSYHIEENVGFLLASNEGLQFVAGFDEIKPNDIMILLSNDVLIHAPFIPQLVGYLALEPKSLVGGILYSHDTGWNRFNGRIYPYLEGWLLATTVQGWKELGYFDKQYSPSDFEDICLSTTALSRGYKLVPLNNPSISHLGGRSYGYDDVRRLRTERNRELFRKKWIK